VIIRGNFQRKFDAEGERLDLKEKREKEEQEKKEKENRDEKVES